MRKLEKAEVVQAIQAKVAKSQIGILTDFKGLKVADMTRLRRQLQEAGAELTVVKNTLLRRAGADDSPLAPLLSHVIGPNALTLGYTDPVLVTKVLIKFAQEKPQLVIKGGTLGGQALSLKDLEALSKLPAREVLLAQLLGVLQGVPAGLVTVLAGVIRNLLNVLVALKDKKAESEPAAPEIEAAPAETVVAEAEATAIEAEAAPAETAVVETAAAAPEPEPEPEPAAPADKPETGE
ncbi:MAG: 50S ribosomal protein L10 [Desulfobacterales bacterium]|nr:50S ribosomal protein L10 [Pseudomonadota bacterium]MBU4355816.1 50S ribosomal protein L10 [Pseudomonadota bacterium]MCG2771089.1 50S ribosomal protein L10 [Desulfobacterales bacterium]